MSEQEIREGMLLAVWDEPPLDFDPDALIRRVEQKKSRRRALVGVGVATAMIVVTSLTLPGLLPRDQDSQLGSGSQTATSAPPSESVDQKAQRIGDGLAEKLGLRMTNLKEVYATFRPGAYAYQANTSKTLPSRPGDPELSGFVHLTDQIGPTAIQVILTKDKSLERMLCMGASTCHDVKQNDGTTVTEAEYTDGGPDITRAVSLRKFQSGYYAQISSFSYNPATNQGLRQTVPVPVAVLTDLVTSPGIAWQ
ncbi:hypothetical protein [Lentzea sp. NPDC004782]|uniref:hypothetical protein n=1 Tax=Lentzea sp. NPDC004782 TaxID=3154458 RepID=UPI0033A37768